MIVSSHFLRGNVWESSLFLENDHDVFSQNEHNYLRNDGVRTDATGVRNDGVRTDAPGVRNDGVRTDATGVRNDGMVILKWVSRTREFLRV